MAPPPNPKPHPLVFVVSFFVVFCFVLFFILANSPLQSPNAGVCSDGVLQRCSAEPLGLFSLVFRTKRFLVTFYLV